MHAISRVFQSFIRKPDMFTTFILTGQS